MAIHAPAPIRTLFHLAEADNWPSIQRDGLLSTSRLLDRAGVTGAARNAVERCQRRGRTSLPDGTVVRDQLPMPPASLRRALVGMTPAEWYALLNGHVFFWLDPDRLARQWNALRATPQMLLVFDAAALLHVHAQAACVTPINTGNARRRPALRSPASFVPYEIWRADGWAGEAAAIGTHPRGRAHRPAELVVPNAVPDAMAFLMDARTVEPGLSFETFAAR